MDSSKPSAYWDRSANVVRDWKTDQPLPEYQGTCLVYLDVEGAVFLQTFLQDGKRCWEQAVGAAASAVQRSAANQEHYPNHALRSRAFAVLRR